LGNGVGVGVDVDVGVDVLVTQDSQGKQREKIFQNYDLTLHNIGD